MVYRSLALALLAALGLAPAAGAVPTLVEFRWSDAYGTLLEAPDSGDDLLSPTGTKSKSKGKSEEAHAKNEAKALSLWISRDGIDWKRADLEITSWSESGATARVKGAEEGFLDGLAGTFGWTTDGSGAILDPAYAGLSSSGETWSGEFSARLVSVQLASVRTVGAIPEPGMLALFGAGLGALGLALRSRRRA